MELQYLEKFNYQCVNFALIFNHDANYYFSKFLPDPDPSPDSSPEPSSDPSPDPSTETSYYQRVRNKMC